MVLPTESGGAGVNISGWGVVERACCAKENTSSGARGVLWARLPEMILELSGTSRGGMILVSQVRDTGSGFVTGKEAGGVKQKKLTVVILNVRAFEETACLIFCERSSARVKWSSRLH